MENFSQRICNLTVSRTFSEKTKEKRAPRHLSGVNKITEIMRRKLSFSRRARCGPFPEVTPRIPTKGMTSGKKLWQQKSRLWASREPPVPFHHDPFGFCVCALGNFTLCAGKIRPSKHDTLNWWCLDGNFHSPSVFRVCMTHIIPPRPSYSIPSNTQFRGWTLNFRGR